jgi:hypothetical protein
MREAMAAGHATLTPIQLPLSSDGVLNDERIGSQQHAIVLDGLADQHPIERVTMPLHTLLEIVAWSDET